MHTWTAAEKNTAKLLARSLPEARVNTARTRLRCPDGSVEEMVDILSQNREELSRLGVEFGVKKPDIVRFFRSVRPAADLRLTSLNNATVEELRAALWSHMSQSWKGVSKAFLSDSAQERDDTADGLRHEWSSVIRIPFKDASRAQAQELLLRMKAEELHRIMLKLRISEADFGGSQAQQVQAILSEVEGATGPHRLLKAMAERHVRTFLGENWEYIAHANDPEGSGYDADPIDYDMKTCQLFILWAWAHM